MDEQNGHTLHHTSDKSNSLFLFVVMFFILSSVEASDLINESPDYLVVAIISEISNNPDLRQIISESTINENYNSRGRLLYENHCIACHISQVHIRENRKAKNLIELKHWVIKRSRAIQLDWGDDEFDAVTLYLSERYYKFTNK